MLGEHHLLLVVLIGVDGGVASLHWTDCSLQRAVPEVLSLWRWAVAVLARLLPRVGEDLLGEETTAVDVDLLLDHPVVSGVRAIPHVSSPIDNGILHATSLVVVSVLVLLVRVLNSRQVLLLLVQAVLVHLLLELDVLLVYSVDLLSEILMLSLEPLDQLVLLFDLCNLVIVEAQLDLDLVPQVDELLGLWYDLDEGLLLGVAGWLALFCLEGALAHLHGVW